jgi:hypothetical protein
VGDPCAAAALGVLFVVDVTQSPLEDEEGSDYEACYLVG